MDNNKNNKKDQKEPAFFNDQLGENKIDKDMLEDYEKTAKDKKSKK